MSCDISTYEPQLVLLGQRTCGAAALCMAYRALGLELAQEEIWERLMRSPTIMGGVRSHLLAADARGRGLASVVVQASDPLALLENCQTQGVAAILNHRIVQRSPWGHFSLLAGIDDAAVWLHDPQAGPNRPHPRSEFLALWSAQPGRTEIAGNVAILITRRDDTCTVQACRNCNSCIDLSPFNESITSAGRLLWRRIYCPTCDVAWSSSMASPFSPVVTFDGND